MTSNTRACFSLVAFIFSCVQLSCATDFSAPEKTGLLQPTEGYTGELIGAEVTRISPVPNENVVKIVVSVPQNPNEIETVDVVDEQGKKIDAAKPFEFSKDADGQPNGVIIYLTKKRQLPFLLNFNAAQQE